MKKYGLIFIACLLAVGGVAVPFWIEGSSDHAVPDPAPVVATVARTPTSLAGSESGPTGGQRTYDLRRRSGRDVAARGVGGRRTG